MIIFYSKDTEEVILASIVKHYNPSAILREYSDNSDLISIAKMHNDSNFIRIKDYKMAILNKYAFPAWVKNDSRIRYVEILLAHKDTTTNEVISYFAKYLFNPEQLFYSSIDKINIFKMRVAQVLNEVSVFKRLAKNYYKNGIIYYEINPKHDIAHLLLNDLIESSTEPIILLNQDLAIAGNAEQLGFKTKIVSMQRFDAFKLKKEEPIIQPAKKSLVKETIAKKLCEF